MESISLRKKASCVRQENACLSMQDEQLFGDLDALQYELATSKSQVHLRGSGVVVEGSAAVMSAQICHLEEELEARTKALMTAELWAEYSKEEAANNEIVVATLTEELSALKEELDNKTAMGKRAEQQRNQALENAEKLKEAFKEYKATVSIKVKRVMESESNLKESLIECDREKEEVERKCTLLQSEKAEQSQTISQLREEVREAKCLAAEHSDLQNQLKESRKQVLLLERQLEEHRAECREQASLRRELENLRSLTQSQDQRVGQSQAELSSLEAILALLHLREGTLGPLCSKPCMLPPVDYAGTAHLLRLQTGEGYQQLLRVLQLMEAERTKRSSLVERLQERLSRAQEEISSLQSSMAQRTSHYQSLHTELLDKVSLATDTEKELKRKSARVAALEKQLQEKTSAYSQAALKNTQLENQLLEKTNSLQHYQTLMTKKQRDYQQSLDKCKKSQSQQCMEQQHRIEMLQLSVEEAQSRMLEIEQEVCLCQRERDEAQKCAVLLQTTVEELTQKQVEVRYKEELLQSFKEQAAQSASKVWELQSSLSVCREELTSYMQQTEDVKRSYESQLQKNNDKVSSLQEKLHSTSLVCQRSTEENMQLQLSLQQQQTMLSESTARISELEDSQSQLQRQVSSLEQELARAQASLLDEVRSRELDTLERDKDLQEINQQNTQLSETVTHITSDLVKFRGELVSKESELQRLRRDVFTQASQIKHMEESLQQTKTNLTSKSDMVVDLEEKLHRGEADQHNCVQRYQILEGQLQTVRGELADTLEQLLQLKDILQTTQTVADERQACVEKLTVQLSETQRELQERTHEVLDMDTALKERQGELQQRAQLLGQLDVAIREHKQEMERKVESLQQTLESRERELRDAQRELTDRNTKESQELSQQLRVCHQKLHNVLQEHAETQLRCEILSRELDTTKLQTKEKEVWLCEVKEELALKEAHWLKEEARLQSMITSLEQEMELEKEQHSKELESLQQTRGQLLKVSEQISSTMRSTQEDLTFKLQQSQTQLEQTKALLDQTKRELDRTQNQASHLQSQLGQSQSQLTQSKVQQEQSQILYEQTRTQNKDLHAQVEQLSMLLNQARVQVSQFQTQLQACHKSIETSNESMLIKESEVMRLQAKISSLERAAGRQNCYNHTPSLPALHTVTHSPQQSSSAHSPASSPKKPQTNTQSLLHSQSPADTYPHLSDLSETHEWLQSSSIDSSLDLPLSLKAVLREALSKQPWSSSSSSSCVSPLPVKVNHSWQGLSFVEATAPSDLSFNPLTYMVDKQEDGTPKMEATSLLEEGSEQLGESRRESVCTLVGEVEEVEEVEEVDVTSLTGMLRFVNQTLAMQDDPSLWTSTGHQRDEMLCYQGDVHEEQQCLHCF
ncbi:coiled-coil domain-containing protein 18 isoform X2 [Solea solea]|uniref:coiled-coil domain-containing protein 18 isoform X2 n=1 Tax=Solea solea TaxID=90069 RepID=UPI002729BAE8|nr:coiled-coil domain-containing protein 18 isoform X2 [Solea solea]